MKTNILTLHSFLLLLIFYCVASHAQQTVSPYGTIHGKVTDVAGETMPGAHVTIVETKQATAADQDGNYRFTNVPAGRYIVQATLIGFATVQQLVEVKLGEVIPIDFSLHASSIELQAVEVIGRKEQTYRNTRSFTGTKTETPLKLVPQAVSYVTKEVLDDRQAFKSSDAFKNISGVNQSSYNDNAFSVRGFNSTNTLVNGLRVSGSGWNQSLLPYVERVEVIKGPASALFANTDPGGTLNKVTKKPLDENRKAINFATGSFNTYRITSDFTGPMNDANSLLYRLNLAYQNAGSFRDLQGGQDIVVAPSFSFIPDEKTMVNFDLVYSTTHGRLDRGQPIFGATTGTQLNSTPISFAIAKQSDYLKEVSMYSTLSLQRKINDHLSLNASYMKFMYDENLLEHRTANRYGVDADGNSIPTLMEMTTNRRMQRNYTDNLTAYIVGDFETGPVKHKLLGGYDYILFQSAQGNSNYSAGGYLAANGTSIITGAYKPANRAKYLIVDNKPVPNVPYFNLEDPDYSIADISNYINVGSPFNPEKYYVHGVYAQEQASWGKFNILLAARIEHYTDVLDFTLSSEKKVKQTAIIPRVGLVYTPIEPVSFYATYTEGYQPQSAATIGAPEIYGGPFDPLMSNMIEGGAKMDLIKKLLTVNIALYRIVQNNVLMNANAEDNPDLLRQIGQQRSQGVEFDVYGQLFSNLSLTANFAINNAEITRSTNPEEVGQVFPNAPKTQGGLWAKYTFINPFLKGIGFGFGSNYSSKKIQSTQITLPAYVVVDASVYYTVDKFKLSVNLNNVFNKTHWLGGTSYQRLFPGTPRNFLLGVGYIF